MLPFHGARVPQDAPVTTATSSAPALPGSAPPNGAAPMATTTTTVTIATPGSTHHWAPPMPPFNPQGGANQQLSLERTGYALLLAMHAASGQSPATATTGMHTIAAAPSPLPSMYAGAAPAAPMAPSLPMPTPAPLASSRVCSRATHFPVRLKTMLDAEAATAQVRQNDQEVARSQLGRAASPKDGNVGRGGACEGDVCVA